jgi:aryl-alcohol dehydrogenase-like predicted oxidoreductase
MRTRTLGRTGITVSEYCLGAMMFGSVGNADVAECEQIVHRALDAGINFIDTADVYSAGQSEEIVGKAIAGRRNDVVLSTKFGMPARGLAANEQGGSRRWIMLAVEASLRRLGTDWIDVYLMHRPDPRTPMEETLGALTDLVRQGKVRAIGTSTFPASALTDASWISATTGREAFAVEQSPYSIFMRGIERDVLPVTRRLNIGTMVWSPLAGGWLTGKYRLGGQDRQEPTMMPTRFDMSRPENQRKLALVEDLLKVADTAGLSLTHLALAWVLQHPGVTSAILGPKTLAQLDDLLGVDKVGALPAEVLDAIDELVAPGSDIDPADRFELTPALSRRERRRS